MLSELLKDTLTKTPEQRRLYEQERAVQEMTDLICEVMEKKGVSRRELAKRLNWSQTTIGNVLDDWMVTARELSQIFTALGHRLHFSVEPLEDK